MLDNRAYYDDMAAGYEIRRHAGYHALLDRLEADFVLRYARGARCLEAGCGTGLVLKEVAREARRAVGLDLSQNMLAAARARGLEVVHGSITSLPFADEEFDVVYSVKVLAHVQQIREALSEMTRVTRPGGHVLAEFYNPWSIRYLIKTLKHPTPISASNTDAAVYTRYDSLSAIRGHLPAGLAIEAIRGVRVVTPFAAVHDRPLVGRLFERLEWRACDAPVLRRLGGFLIVAARKTE